MRVIEIVRIPKKDLERIHEQAIRHKRNSNAKLILINDLEIIEKICADALVLEGEA